MIKSRILISQVIVIVALVVLIAVTASAQISQVTTNHKKLTCSIATIAGEWMFATDIGYFPNGVHATALGTFNVGTDGSLNGTFDYNGNDGFVPGLTYAGSVSVNRDCTGIARFTDSTGANVIQSIVIVRGGQEIWGAFQDPSVIWSYKAKRITKRD